MKSNKPLVLILCGGKSLRLWPLSEYRSKNFLNFFGLSPLELTIKRFLKLTSKENIFLAANYKEKTPLRKIKLIKKENIFFEPVSKNTAAAVLLSLQYLKKRFKSDWPSKKIIISPVDQIVKNENSFFLALQTALKSAEDGWIATLGIKPKEPSPNFGYIQKGKNIFRNIWVVKKFIEKPTAKIALKLIRQKHIFYNSGIFVSSLDTLEQEYQKHYPDYPKFVYFLKKRRPSYLYKKIKNIPFDKAIAEKSSRLCLVLGKFWWVDFGSWPAIHEILPKDKFGNAVRDGVFVCRGENNFIYLDDLKKKVLVLGLKDVFFIDTPHFVLLANRFSLDSLKMILGKFNPKFALENV